MPRGVLTSGCPGGSGRCNVDSMEIPGLFHFFLKLEFRNLRAESSYLVSTSLAHSGDDEDSVDPWIISLFFFAGISGIFPHNPAPKSLYRSLPGGRAARGVSPTPTPTPTSGDRACRPGGGGELSAGRNEDSVKIMGFLHFSVSRNPRDLRPEPSSLVSTSLALSLTVGMTKIPKIPGLFHYFFYPGRRN